MQLAKHSARQAAEVHLQALQAQLESVQCRVQSNTPTFGASLEATGSAVVHKACPQPHPHTMQSSRQNSFIPWQLQLMLGLMMVGSKQTQSNDSVR